MSELPIFGNNGEHENSADKVWDEVIYVSEQIIEQYGSAPVLDTSSKIDIFHGFRQYARWWPKDEFKEANLMMHFGRSGAEYFLSVYHEVSDETEHFYYFADNARRRVIKIDEMGRELDIPNEQDAKILAHYYLCEANVMTVDAQFREIMYGSSTDLHA